MIIKNHWFVNNVIILAKLVQEVHYINAINARVIVKLIKLTNVYVELISYKTRKKTVYASHQMSWLMVSAIRKMWLILYAINLI